MIINNDIAKNNLIKYSTNTSVNLELLKNKLIDSKLINAKDKFDIDILKSMLIKKISEINYNEAKEDVLPFINDVQSIELWNKDFFVSITMNLN